MAAQLRFVPVERDLGAVDLTNGRSYTVIGWINLRTASYPILVPDLLSLDDDLTVRQDIREFLAWAETLAYVTR